MYFFDWTIYERRNTVNRKQKDWLNMCIKDLKKKKVGFRHKIQTSIWSNYINAFDFSCSCQTSHTLIQTLRGMKWEAQVHVAIDNL